MDTHRNVQVSHKTGVAVMGVACSRKPSNPADTSLSRLTLRVVYAFLAIFAVTAMIANKGLQKIMLQDMQPLVF